MILQHTPSSRLRATSLVQRASTTPLQQNCHTSAQLRRAILQTRHHHLCTLRHRKFFFLTQQPRKMQEQNRNRASSAAPPFARTSAVTLPPPDSAHLLPSSLRHLFASAPHVVTTTFLHLFK
ncbi:hypothetical protein DEO72_LG3g1572 [Vigna unguiculata]|uniref:Uncharacterized protein n=1 Tax=Vigna unguiculata TaxID=3917 RepID=A0A4D6LEJ9_VIGUN|nr:hypothetical protein DEO72_LG3g1572 [Vigna unguiculata]